MRKHKTFLILLLLHFVLLSDFVTAKEFKGAEYRTKEDYLYGRFEVNYKSPSKDGILASFFTYFTGNDSIPWTTWVWNEIDIEILGRYNDNVQFNPITPGQVNHVRSNFVNFDPSEDFHTYAFEWTPEYVAWFIDGVEVHRQTGSHIEALQYPQKIMMNIWNPQYENWVGEWNPAVLPAFAYYDWVKYYSYTPGSGDSGTDNNFTFNWVDEFDSFDDNKWSKATHTWGGNGCDFITENAVLENGNLILCLTDATNIGFTDKTPPTILKIRAEKNFIDVFFSESLDSVSAQIKSNYTITNVTINSATLLENKKVVRLNVSELDSAISYNLITLNIKDIAPLPNKMAGKLISFSVAEQLTFPLKINVGGAEKLDFISDQDWALDKEFGRTEGSNTDYTSSISLTDLDEIYRSDRNGIVSYKIRVPNGYYNLKLMFAEKSAGTIGQRVFDVFVEGNIIEDNFDILSHVPKNAAYDIDIQNLEISDGMIDINFCQEKNLSILSGIVVDQITTGIDGNFNSGQNLNYGIKHNYPNPFNGMTHIEFFLPKKNNVVVKIYDILGNEIYKQDYENLQIGSHQFTWNAINKSGVSINSGVYFFNLVVDNYSLTEKMVYIK